MDVFIKLPHLPKKMSQESNNTVSEAKIQKYFEVTRKALEKIKKRDGPILDKAEAQEEYLQMAQSYFSDAEHFYKNGEIVTAFAALNYAHGWLDAGARLGLFDVDADNVLFVVDQEWMDKLNKKKDKQN